MAVLLQMFSTERSVFAMSESSGCEQGASLTPCLKPVGFQPTIWTVGLVLMVATEAYMSLTTTSPRYSRHTDRYSWLGPRGSHLIMKLAGSKAADVICGVVCCSWPVLAFEMTGAKACIMK